MKKRLSITGFGLLLLLALIVAACSPNPPTPTEKVSDGEATRPPATLTSTATAVPPTETAIPPTATITPTPTPQVVAYSAGEIPTNVNPLTGLIPEDPSILDRRPVAVKVQMFPRGQRPPWGVSLADIVFDFYQNFGATRFHAVFYGQDAEQVGPIRSGRLLDADLVQMYKSVFGFGSADQRILTRINDAIPFERLIFKTSPECPPDPMCRIDPNGFNYLITDTSTLSSYAAANGVSNERQDLSGMSFDPELPDNGSSAERVFIYYNHSNYNRWDYDAESGRYLRFQETSDAENGNEFYEPLVDRLTEQQIAADNLVVLYAVHEYAFNTRPGLNEIVSINLGGSGTAYAFRDGQAFEVRWNRPSTSSVLYLTYPDGSPFPYKNGTTFYQVIGQSSKVEKNIGEQGNDWRFSFGIP